MKHRNYGRFFCRIRSTSAFIIAIQAIHFFILSCSASTSEIEPKLQNPFCSVETIVQADLHTQGRALIEPNGRAVIRIGLDEAEGDPAYRDFLLAHECCHHTRGHLQRLKKKQKERMFMDRSFVNRSVELDADCCAAVTLARTGRKAAIREAARRMQSYGARPTGSGGYPAGNLRAMLIKQCAASVNAAPRIHRLSQPDRPATGARH